ncbi:uncharacterized protein LOC142493673 [Ascaphus truei]|uniref:uncharacterized protein LOC142493673 n=1 Tax=Ascaphus truei TaxID=8439 RepID=UPI003F5A93A5
MGTEQECNNEMAGCVSPTSMDAEEDMITLHTVSPNLVPSCSVPEVITASQATNVTSNDADAGIEKHLESFERCEEKMMLLHQDRHEQIMGVHGKLLSEMIQIKDIMKHTNELLLNHNAFMGSIAQSLKKIVDRDNVSTSSPPLLGTRQIPLPSQSVLVGQVEDITDITPHPLHTKLPIEVNPSAGVQKDADNGTDRTNIQKFDPWQTATEAIVECPQQLFNDDFQQERLLDIFHAPNDVPVAREGTPVHMRAGGLWKRCRKGSYNRGRGRNVKRSTSISGPGYMTPFVPPPKETNVAYTIPSAQHTQVMDEIVDEIHVKKITKRRKHVTRNIDRPHTRSQQQ